MNVSMSAVGYIKQASRRPLLSGSVVLLVLLLGLLLVPACLQAAPFAKNFQFTQPNGVQLDLWGEGDEFHAVFETTAGYTVAFDPQKKAYFYMERGADGKSLVSTGVLADAPAPPNLVKHVRMDRDAVASAARARQKKWDTDTGLSKRWTRLKTQTLGTPVRSGADTVLPSSPATTTLGVKAGLTLLIDFSDAPATISQTEIDAFLNGDAYTGFGNNGSVKKYFSDVSAGKLTYTNQVTAYVRMIKPKSYYNNISSDCGVQARELINDALAILKQKSDYTGTILPTFNALTTDGAGNVAAFNVFYAGANSGAWGFGLWPHSWNLASTVPLGNGKSISNYQITNVGNSLELGTFCHENGHMICDFPDIYDYDYDSVGGAGKFCLMGSGGHGTNPSQVNAYLKLAAGWATSIDVSSSSNLTGTLVAAPNSGYDTFYRYQKAGISTEYFLFENRQKTGRDAALPSAGIAVWHVDELGDRDNQSLTPNSSHLNYELTLVQADNQWHFETTTTNGGDAFDLYYQGNNAAAYTNRFDGSSSPNANWWNGSASGMNVSSFSVAGTSMVFSFGTGGSSLPAPVIAAEPAVTPGTVNTIYWNAVTPAGIPVLPEGTGAGKNFQLKVASPVVTEYYAECANNAGFSSPLNSGWITQPQWTVSSLTPGQTYWYRVKARSGSAESGWSNSEFSQQEPPPSSLQFSSASYPVNENGGSVSISVTRAGGSSGTVGITYATSNGTAAAGSDYTSTSGTLLWADGDTKSKTFTVPIIIDTNYEGNETFTVTLSSPTGGATLGSQGTATVTIVEDKIAPVITTFTVPSSSNSLVVNGINLLATDDFGVTGYLLGETSVPPAPSAAGWSSAAPIKYQFTSAGNKTLYAFVKDAAGNISAPATASVIIDTTPPELILSTLQNGAVTTTKTLNISGSVTDSNGIAALTINAIPVTVKTDASFSHAVTLVNGENQITTVATDIPGNQTTDQRTISYGKGPTLNIITPADNSKTAQLLATVTGTVDETSTVVITSKLDGLQTANMNNNSFSATVTLESGLNTIDLTATDLLGNSSSAKRSVTYDPVKPTLAITSPENDVTVHNDKVIVAGTVNGTISGIASLIITADGKEYQPTVTNGGFSQEITLTAEKLYPITVIVTDEAGNSETATRNIIYLKGMIAINGGAIYTITPKVTLSLEYHPAAPQIQLFYNNKSWSKAEPFTATKMITLPNGDGLRAVTVRFLDYSGTNLGEYTATITLDTKVPTGTIKINSGALYINNRNVNLEITATDITSGMSKFCIKESTLACSEAEFEPFITSKEYTITSPADGKKTIYATLKDLAGKFSKPIKASITIDTIAPSGTVLINGDKPDTTTPMVTLNIKAVKASEMRLSLDGGASWLAWEKFAGNKKVTLPAGAGKKSVQIRFKDLAGNESGIFEDFIMLK